jgi:hypothetical protein
MYQPVQYEFIEGANSSLYLCHQKRVKRLSGANKVEMAALRVPMMKQNA